MVGEGRPLRADAARKREQIIAAAAAELADLAGASPVGAGGRRRLSLDAVAARAGVGVGTLYRHFPTREALLEAVYRHELDDLCAAAPALAAAGPADDALLSWMLRYVEFVDSKRAMGEDLRALVAAGAVTQAETRRRLGDAIAHFLSEGAAADLWRHDVPVDDVVAAMAGAVIGAAGDQRLQQTERLLRLLVDGLRRPSSTRSAKRSRLAARQAPV